MKRALAYVFSIGLLVGGAFLLLNLYNKFKPQQTGALQVSANVASDVYLDGEFVGETPFCRGDISLCAGVAGGSVNGQAAGRIVAGQHNIKVTPKDDSLSPYVVDIDVYAGVMTAVDRTFLPDGLSSSYTLTLEKKNGGAGLFVQSIPSNAVVSVDGVSAGVTPFRDEDISTSSHVLEIQKDGFAKKTIKVRAVDGYLLVVNVILGASSGDEVDAQKDEEKEASGSAETSEDKSNIGSVKILDTPTGFLRVRSGAGVANDEVGRVEPEDIYPLLSDDNGWYEIQLEDGTTGWISSEYAEKQE